MKHRAVEVHKAQDLRSMYTHGTPPVNRFAACHLQISRLNHSNMPAAGCVMVVATSNNSSDDSGNNSRLVCGNNRGIYEERVHQVTMAVDPEATGIEEESSSAGCQHPQQTIQQQHPKEEADMMVDIKTEIKENDNSERGGNR